MRLLPLILALSLVAAGCEDDDSPTGPSPSTTTVTLAPGGQTNALGLTIVFTQVVSDSRCPADALCGALGDAVVAVTLSLGGVGSPYELYAVDATKRRVTFQGYQVELSTLQPYPLASRPTDPTAYRATLLVTKE
jgi:hypothetical protein